NMIIDWLAQELFTRPFDKNGTLAARGTVLEPVLRQAQQDRYFRMKPPRAAGREQFGREYAAGFLVKCRKSSNRPEDALATATAFTAETIAQGYRRFVQKQMRSSPVDYILSGGGARNRTLVAMLKERLEPLGCEVKTSDAVGLPAEAKEAAAFALL